ncbi:sugar phosphate nucleotidyltransferase [Aquimarina agarivorans]|uniref:sugar phosphate nucleotidyltransferase n=1 Tax=Aquimarina agarivorans TaxID=980584 RepID=UPI000248EBE1|nr:sugar phosphate nucleotidyltransferase [Aquimarina agarivorans]
MRIIVPMAGRGSRLRPHTLTVPKPLIPIAGKPIVQRLVEDIAKVVNEPVDEVAFVTDRSFGVEDQLTAIAESLGAKASVYYQDEPLGTGHAIMCAKDSLSGPCIVAYADTLFKADFELDPTADAVIWVKQVAQPEQYGVVKLNTANEIVELVEKPKEKVSDLAVIGIYYFKSGEALKESLQKVLDANLMHGGEYQINDGIKGLMAQGKIFKTGKVTEWMDCGNKTVTVDTNSKMLNFIHQDGEENLVSKNVSLENSEIIAPCFIGNNVKLVNAKVGPNVSIGNDCELVDVTISNSLVQNETKLENAVIKDSMIGNKVRYNGKFTKISIGDYSQFE